LSFSRDEAGHAAGQSKLLAMRETGDYDVKLFCPQCGWILSFGREPNIGSIRKCPMCGAKSILDEEEGDFLLKVVM
jgi:rubrerythrin